MGAAGGRDRGRPRSCRCSEVSAITSAIKKALEDGFARGDEASLVAFYDALLADDVLVAPGAGEAQHPVTLASAGAVDGDRGTHAPPALLLGGLRGAEGEAVVAAFTGDEELDAWAGWGVERVAVNGGVLAGALLDAGVHELSINPAGPVGRRLDVLELRQLAAGLRPRFGRAGFGFDPRSGIALAPPLPELPVAVADGLAVVCAHNADIAAAFLVDLMQPLRSAEVTLAVALEVDDPGDAARREALMELIGAVVTQVPAAELDGIGFLWLDGRLAGIARGRVRAAYRRDGA